MIEATYILSLPSSDARRATMTRLLAETALPNPIWWEGVDGRTLTATSIDQMQQEGLLGRDLSAFDQASRNGEIACALGHAAILREIVRANHTAALVLEDDVVLAFGGDEWRTRLESALRELPRDWDLFYLYRCLDVFHRTRPHGPNTVIPYAPLGAAAYALSREGARALMESATPAKNAIDRTYSDAVRQGHIRAFAATPRLILAGEHPSIINSAGPRRWVVDGVNAPPEYWPPRFYGYIGEPRWRAWQRRLEIARSWLSAPNHREKRA